MDSFTRLFVALDGTTKTTAKLTALEAYFRDAEESERLWAIWLLTGNRPKRAITTTQLKDWATAEAGLPRWLFDESYVHVGDLGETISLVLGRADGGAASGSARLTLAQIMREITSLKERPETERQRYIAEKWRGLGQTESFLFTKLITGSFRVGVARALAVRALARVLELDPAELQHRLLGGWDPATARLSELLTGGASLRPYPFFLASPVEDPARLGEPDDWQAEWKWDGIRGQIVRRGDETAVWSRGEELVSEQFPELMEMGTTLPDGTVLDGEIMPWDDDGPLSFAVLQTRLGRKNVTAKFAHEAPVKFVAYDLLELGGVDLRREALSDRRGQLDSLVDETGDARLLISPVVTFRSWEELALLRTTSREQHAEGFVLKRRSSEYRTGRVRGDWWKWKIEPYTIDAVLTTAQRGHGRRAGLYTDYTFAIWDGPVLVPIAKAYSGLTDAEITEVDKFVSTHTVEKFGPIRTVKPELVFELAFEGIALSKRHKSGLAVRFPRILRWRRDKPASEADSVVTVRSLFDS
jgi:DNA ligase-1